MFDAHFTGGNATYRAYRFAWTGHADDDAVGRDQGQRRQDGRVRQLERLDDAEQVAGARRLVGQEPEDGRRRRQAAFETSFKLGRREGYVEVQALDSHGKVLATSGGGQGLAP